MNERALTVVVALRRGTDESAVLASLGSIASEGRVAIELLLDRGQIGDSAWAAVSDFAATLPKAWSVRCLAAPTQDREAEQVERLTREAKGRHVALLQPGEIADGAWLSALEEGLLGTRCAVLAHPVSQLQLDGATRLWTLQRGLGQLDLSLALSTNLHRSSLCWDRQLVMDWPALGPNGSLEAFLQAILVRAILTGLIGWTPQSTLSLPPALHRASEGPLPTDPGELAVCERALSREIRAALVALREVQSQRQRAPRSGRVCDQVTGLLLRRLVEDTERWTLTRNALIVQGLRPFWVGP